MKRISISIITLAGFLLFLAVPSLGSAQSSAYTEIIRSYDTSIIINKDASIDITEKIEYDFGANQKHGIYRDIPIRYKARGGNFALRISNINVTDENGKDYRFSKTQGFASPNIRLKIGDPDKYVTGLRTYVINYKIKRAINYFSGHDELYWNAIGTKWQVAIESARAFVVFPEEVEAKNLKYDSFAGPTGSTQECTSTNLLPGGSNAIDGIEFYQNGLALYEGLTFVVGLPKGILRRPTFFETALEILRDNGILFLPVATLAFFLWLWRSRGRDPMGRGVVITQFEAPESLTPSEIGTIVDETVHNKDISADIINLAVKGYLKIIRIEEEKLLGIFGTRVDYVLEKLKSERDLPNGFERKLMTSLFKPDLTKLLNSSLMDEGSEQITKNIVSPESVRLSDLKDKFYKDMKDIRSLIYRSVVQKGYFPASPRMVKGIYAVLGITIIGLGVILVVTSILGYLGVFSIVFSGIIALAFAPLMPVKTKKGAVAREHILGLKEYLTVAEKDRLKFHNAPEKNPKHFEELLPYAISLGVEEQWAEQFKDIFKEQPSWYYDASGRALNSSIFASDLHSFTTSANTILTSSPSSTAAGGGSGFSGGGSGGGGGGGGGGSW